MSNTDVPDLIAACVAEYQELVDSGSRPALDTYRPRLGQAYPEFLVALTATSDDAVAALPGPDESFPLTFGPFMLLERLGAGGMGVVYDALHRTLGRRVAVKVLHTETANDPIARERFKRESRACVRVRHPSIVEIYDAGEVNGRAYYSMELLEGAPLDRLTAEEQPSVTEILTGFAGIADALETLHHEGVVHRDVKPGNIILRDDGSMVLADFGLVKALDTPGLTADGRTLGTPLYASPEQLRGDNASIDGRSDVYALGATIYHVLSGKPPFEASDIGGLFRKVMNERPAALIGKRDGVHAPCEHVVLTALEKRREDRYATAAAMRDDLLAVVAGDAPRGRPVSALKRALRAVWKQRIAAAVVGAVIAGLVFWSTTRPATLRVTSFPPARVVVDGADLGLTPQLLELSPGSHLVRIGRTGFGAYEETIDLAAGSDREIHQALVVEDSDDFMALCCLADALGIKVTKAPELGVPVAGRDGAGPSGAVLLPAGDVRAADLDEWSIDAPGAGEQPGRVVFYRGGDVVSSAPIVLAAGRARGVLPTSVARGLAPGESVEWGWFPDDGEPVETSFGVATFDIETELARIEKQLRGQPSSVVRHLKAEVLLSRGLYTAAIREAVEVHGDPACEERATEIRRLATARLIDLSQR